MENKVSDTSDIIFNQVKSEFNQYSLNENNVNDYVMRVMNLVKMDNKLLSSFVKKIVVIEVINKLLDELTPESKASLQLNINKILSEKNNFFV